jgi:hypothetical protein
MGGCSNALVTAVVGEDGEEEDGDVEDKLEDVGEEEGLERSAVGQTLVTGRRDMVEVEEETTMMRATYRTSAAA